jgi:hypothetical protein
MEEVTRVAGLDVLDIDTELSVEVEVLTRRQHSLGFKSGITTTTLMAGVGISGVKRVATTRSVTPFHPSRSSYLDLDVGINQHTNLSTRHTLLIVSHLMSRMAITGPPEWQNAIRARLMAQQAQGDALRDMTEQCEIDESARRVLGLTPQTSGSPRPRATSKSVTARSSAVAAAVATGKLTDPRKLQSN